ncbi:hypothetical protein SK128_027993, partial [Halocaridina rubra]
KVEKERINHRKKNVNRTEWNTIERYDRIIEMPNNPVIEEEDCNSEKISMDERVEKENRRNTEEVLRNDNWYASKDACNVNGTTYDNDSDPLKKSKVDNNDGDSDSDNEILNELRYDSEEEELDIPTEENFLKSSTSISGDDEAIDVCYGRPRSVHFEDETWEDGEYRLKDERDNEHNIVCDETYQQRRQETLVHRQYDVTKDLSLDFPLSKRGRLSNVKSANKESVREILRRKREGASDALEQDSRRRVTTSLERKINDSSENLYESRRRSRSRETVQRDRNSVYRNSEDKIEKNYTGNHCCVDSEARHRKSRSRSPKKESLYGKGGIDLNSYNRTQNSAGVIISKRDYAMFKTLVGSQNRASERTGRNIKKIFEKSKKNIHPKSGNHK